MSPDFSLVPVMIRKKKHRGFFSHFHTPHTQTPVSPWVGAYTGAALAGELELSLILNLEALRAVDVVVDHLVALGAGLV